jgi:uncharacterized lipoprotein YehR (DUF1307 family)
MKKVIAFILSLALALTLTFSLTSCGEDEKPKKDDNGKITLPFVPAS